MRVKGEHYRTIWSKPGDQRVVQIIDQRALPFEFVIEDIASVQEMARAIKVVSLSAATERAGPLRVQSLRLTIFDRTCTFEARVSSEQPYATLCASDRCAYFYTCTYIHTYIRIFSNPSFQTSIPPSIHPYVRMHFCMRHAYMHTCAHIRACVCTYVCMYVCMYVRACVRTYVRMTYVRTRVRA